MSRMPHGLSKSRYTAGVQCHKLLWWKVHEPLAVELQPDKVLQDRFDQGAHVGTLARDRFPGGVLIDQPHQAVYGGAAGAIGDTRTLERPERRDPLSYRRRPRPPNSPVSRGTSRVEGWREPPRPDVVRALHGGVSQAETDVRWLR